MSALRFLFLNCQRNYNPKLLAFLQSTLSNRTYDFLVLQEMNDAVFNGLTLARAYKVLRVFDSELGEYAQECIVYKSMYRLKRKQLMSFSKLIAGRHPVSFLTGTFSGSSLLSSPLTIGSAHLHPGICTALQNTETRMISHVVSQSRRPTIFGGDFNLVNEHFAHRAGRLFPGFFRITCGLRALNSVYTEPAPHLLNRLARFFGRFDLGVTLPTDQVFIDEKTMRKITARCRLLSDRVSDHSAIEIVLSDSGATTDASSAMREGEK